MRRNAFITQVQKVYKGETQDTLYTSEIKSDVYTEIYLVRLSVTGGSVASYEAGIQTSAGRYPLISGTSYNGRVSFPFYSPVMLPYGSRAYVTVTSPDSGTVVTLLMMGMTYPKDEG
jgi:hypothetical protein